MKLFIYFLFYFQLLRFEEHERKLTNEVECLHQTEKLLRNQLEQLDNSNRSQTELINLNGEESQQTLMTELQTLKNEFTKMKELNTNLNTQLQDQTKYSQKCIEQFQQGRKQKKLSKDIASLF